MQCCGCVVSLYASVTSCDDCDCCCRRGEVAFACGDVLCICCVAVWCVCCCGVCFDCCGMNLMGLKCCVCGESGGLCVVC